MWQEGDGEGGWGGGYRGWKVGFVRERAALQAAPGRRPSIARASARSPQPSSRRPPPPPPMEPKRAEGVREAEGA